MVYKDSSLRKYPWLWRYDSRRKRGCAKVGHRYKWFRIKESKDDCYFGLCKHCDKSRLLTIQLDQFARGVDIKKQYLITEVKTISQEDAKELMRARTGDGRSGQSEMKGKCHLHQENIRLRNPPEAPEK